MSIEIRDSPQFYLTAPSPCPYLKGKQERKVFTHLIGERAARLNDVLSHGGFRRSQTIAYRPACESMQGLRIRQRAGRRLRTGPSPSAAILRDNG